MIGGLSTSAERKIVYSAHTGDIINNWQADYSTSSGLARSSSSPVTTMKVLDDAGMPNGVIPATTTTRAGRRMSCSTNASAVAL